MSTLKGYDPIPRPRPEAVLMSREQRWLRTGEGHGSMRRRGQASLATAALMVLTALSACTGSSDDPTTPAPVTSEAPTTSPAPSPTLPTTPAPTPTRTSATQAAAANAEAAVRNYYRVIDKLGSNPKASLAPLKAVAISTDLSVWQHEFERERREGWHQSGTTRIVDIQVESVNLDNSDPKAGVVPSVQIDVCYDVSDVDVTDSTGESVVTPDRPDVGWTRHTVSNYSWDTDPSDGWRVSTTVDLKKSPCTAR